MREIKLFIALKESNELEKEHIYPFNTTVSINILYLYFISFIELFAGINVNKISVDVDLKPNEIRYTSQFSHTYRKTVTHGTFGLSFNLDPFTNVVIDYNACEIQMVTLVIFLSLI